MKKLPFKKPAIGSSLSSFTNPRLLLPIVAVLVLGVGAFFILQLFDDEAGERGGADAAPHAFHGHAKTLAANVAARLAEYQRALAELAARDDVRAAFTANDPAKLSELGASLAPKLDGILLLRLLPAETRDPHPEANPPLSYGSISMLIKSRASGTEIPSEVHVMGTPVEHLVLIKRVEIPAGSGVGQTLLGFLHLSVATDVVRQVLMTQPLDDAYVELRQGPGMIVAASGRKPEGNPSTATAPIAESRLVVAISIGAPPVVTAAAGDGTLSLLIFAGFLLLGLGVGAYVFMRRRGPFPSGQPSADTVIYQGALKAILEGVHPGLEQLLPGMRRDDTSITEESFGERAENEDTTTFNAAARPPSAAAPVAANSAEEPADFLDIGIGLIEIDASIFRSYDIRGIVGESLTEDAVYLIGRALGAEANARGQKTVVVARDGRHSSEGLLAALAKGLLESGRDVLDIGLAPTPVLYFATHYFDSRSGVMVTGSHNPSQYNGLKIVLDGETLSGEAIQAIRRRVMEHDFVDGTGSIQSTDIIAEYIRRIGEEIPVSLGDALKVVVDCGNGVPGMVAPAILRAIGHDVVELFCDVDGDFPNHHPDPSQPENLQQLIEAVAEEGADLGLAFDGDGDRLGVVDNRGNIIWPDRQMILFARDVISRNPGAKIIYDVKCSRHLAREITACGGEPIMSRSGHSLIKARMQETGALLAGEMSGHIFFKERWYGFDDALYSAARLLEILVNSAHPPAEVFAALPGGVATPELRLDMPESRHAEFMQQVFGAAKFPDGESSTIDGLRVDFSDSWGLIRPSNTTPCLVLRFEGDDQAALDRIQARFRDLLFDIDPQLSLPF